MEITENAFALVTYDVSPSSLWSMLLSFRGEKADIMSKRLLASRNARGLGRLDDNEPGLTKCSLVLWPVGASAFMGQQATVRPS